MNKFLSFAMIAGMAAAIFVPAAHADQYTVHYTEFGESMPAEPVVISQPALLDTGCCNQKLSAPAVIETTCTKTEPAVIETDRVLITPAARNDQFIARFAYMVDNLPEAVICQPAVLECPPATCAPAAVETSCTKTEPAVIEKGSSPKRHFLHLGLWPVDFSLF